MVILTEFARIALAIVAAVLVLAIFGIVIGAIFAPDVSAGMAGPMAGPMGGMMGGLMGAFVAVLVVMFGGGLIFGGLAALIVIADRLKAANEKLDALAEAVRARPQEGRAEPRLDLTSRE